MKQGVSVKTEENNRFSLTCQDCEVKQLGPCNVRSPVVDLVNKKGTSLSFAPKNKKILVHTSLESFNKYKCSEKEPPTFLVAGPSEKIYFDPSKTHAAIVTCGGLSPGLNDVIRSVVMELWYRYNVHSIWGIRFGYNGFYPEYGYEPVALTPEYVHSIHTQGGTVLGSSRGHMNVSAVVDALETMNINLLFTIGGDGTLRGALEIQKEIERRGKKIAVIGIPKTIDNDIAFIEKSFGFETAFSMAVESISAAHTEAKSAFNGIGLVKLMGRHSGFIAAHATLAMSDVNFLLVPEVPFDLEGPNGFLSHLKARLEKRQHALIVVAEGAGQDLIPPHQLEYDKSGNVKLADIGVFLKKKITEYFKEQKIEFTLKYIDPSYIIRSAPATPDDSAFALQLGQNAVHAGMAGYTGITIGLHHDIFVYIPIETTVSHRKVIDTDSQFWWNCMETTGQPISLVNE